CVFYGDYYGIQGQTPVKGKQAALDPLLYARYHKAYGEQKDYLDDPHTIGWVRQGVSELKGSGCAVVVTNADDGQKRMFVGKHRAGEQWTDLTGRHDHIVQIEQDGYGVFPVRAGSVSVWALPGEDDSLEEAEDDVNA
ncbi:alpha-amylase domain-containing protein, partial [Paenibacillus terrae]|uniref:alpha-amylase domain-containing protein n=1 Tax=Paenibacillus terrae TaxID=159743 RepID=UPI00336557EE